MKKPKTAHDRKAGMHAKDILEDKSITQIDDIWPMDSVDYLVRRWTTVDI